MPEKAILLHGLFRSRLSMLRMAWGLRAQGFDTFVEAPAQVLQPVTSAFAEPGGHELIAVRDVDDFVARTGWRVS